MTVKEFEETIITKRGELLKEFKNKEDLLDLDSYVKAILDYQEETIKILVNEINILKGDIKRDNRERFETIMKKLDDIENS